MWISSRPSIRSTPSFKKNSNIPTSGLIIWASVLLNNNNSYKRIRENKIFQEILKKYKDSFSEKDLQDIIEKEFKELDNTNSELLKNNRAEFIWLLIANLEKFLAKKSTTIEEAKNEIVKLKEKISSCVDISMQWKMKAVIELALVEWWPVEKWYENKPFYLEDWEVRFKSKFGDFDSWSDISFWRDFKVINVKSEQAELITNELNRLYNWVKKLKNKSTFDINKYIWMLVEVIQDSKNLEKYKLELQDQPWYDEEIKK